ncbi:MAG TPA: tripartite tricarboxylate transporter substrate-binding protein [Pseudolabrys sp.]|nr:tripartite tricarboxylate transporter substrate-binding protein [Pseudolabrys sp.]
MLAPYIQKHLGARLVRLKNVPGAGGLRGSNELWRANPDGLTIGFTNVPVLVMAQLAKSPGVQFDATKFVYLGRAASEPRVLVVGAKGGIHTIADVKKLGRPFAYASQGTDEDFYSTAVLADALGFNLRLVTGYEGNSDTTLSVIKGDTDCHMMGWIAAKSGVDAGDLRVLLTMTKERLSDLPNTPTALELTADPTKKRMINAVITILDMSRGFFGPPKMDNQATKEMRAAIAATFKDPALLAEAKKRRFDLDFASGEKLQNGIDEVVAQDKTLSEILRKALKSIQ